MDLPSILLIAVGLSLDALAVAICSGLVVPQVRVRDAVAMASFFGGFQVLMPVLGWLAGLALRSAIAGFDHWVAFALLAGVGGKMIWEAVRKDSCETRPDPFRLGTLFVLAVATSIDALAVGVTFSLLASSIVLPVAIIGAVTFSISLGGVYAGRRFGAFLGNKAEIAGGIILIGIGVKILIEHLA
jgi:manganese efflux pump family protein